ncbi:MAG: hypothetical protein ABI425_03175 [Patescibacteria group bacterium]
MKIKASLLSLTLAGTFILSATPVFAEESNTLFLRREDNMEARVTKQEERIETMKAKVTERAGERQERRTDMAQKHAGNLETRFNEMYKRLSTLASKIQTRINAVKAEGKDTAAAQTKLDAAKASLESAKSLGQEAITAFKGIDPAKYDEQRSKALAAKDKAEQARKAFMTALQDMKDAVAALKALRPTE